MSKLPSIATARGIAKANGLDGCVVIGFAHGEISIASYGATKRKCAALKPLGKLIMAAIENGDVPLDAFATDDSACPWPMLFQD